MSAADRAGGRAARAADVQAEPSTPQSTALTTQAAIADMKGNPQQARDLANQAIRADPRDPWPYYNKGMALAELGEIDAALAALYAAEKHFAPTDRWGHSVGDLRSGPCAQPGGPLRRSASRRSPNTRRYVGKDDPAGADMARRYAVNCRVPAPPAPAQPPPKG